MSTDKRQMRVEESGGTSCLVFYDCPAESYGPDAKCRIHDSLHWHRWGNIFSWVKSMLSPENDESGYSRLAQCLGYVTIKKFVGDGGMALLVRVLNVQTSRSEFTTPSTHLIN